MSKRYRRRTFWRRHRKELGDWVVLALVALFTGFFLWTLALTGRIG